MIIFIPGALIATLTFPGVILHEVAHKLACDLYRVPVYEVKYFAVSSKAGHVIHGTGCDFRQQALIGLAPLLINSIVFFLFLAPVILPILLGTLFVTPCSWSGCFLFWVGISCGLNALPSKADLAHIDKSVSWRLIYIKKLVQILNFCGPMGALLWLMIVFIPLFVVLFLCSFFLQISLFANLSHYFMQ